MQSRKKNLFVQNIIPFLILALGLAIMAYPSFSDWWNSKNQSRAISYYVTSVKENDTESIERLLNDARAYNDYILTKSNVFSMSAEDIDRYDSLLDISGKGIMGYVQIDSIGVNLPIYHGTNAAVLQKAIGHLEWTSLPVGGPSTHSVLSGHRGLPSAKLFSSLDKVKIGDVFTVTVLNETLTYLVDKISIVNPDDTSDLMIIDGLDLCTLVTCTPYGINTHRLLVRGHRIKILTTEETIINGASRLSNIIVFLTVFVPVLFIILICILVKDYIDFELKQVA
ncbi:MAG: class C sortase [Oscillospiraceae bacterium]|nr:class C sortase [Oscillospiraceae bacterium]